MVKANLCHLPDLMRNSDIRRTGISVSQHHCLNIFTLQDIMENNSFQVSVFMTLRILKIFINYWLFFLIMDNV